MVSGFVDHRIITNSVDHKVDINNRYSSSIGSSEEKAALFLSSLYSAYFLIKYNDRYKVIKYIDDDIDDTNDAEELAEKVCLISDSEISPISCATDAKLVFTADSNNNAGSGDNGLNINNSNNHVKRYNNGYHRVSSDACDTVDSFGVVSTSRLRNGNAGGVDRDDEDDEQEDKQNLMTYYVTVWIYIWSAFTHLVGP